MSKPVAFVIGATGNIGVATVSSLSAKFGDTLEIRAGVRNPDKADKLKELKNVAVVKAEMGSADLESTLKGVDRLYIIAPGTENRAELVSKTAESAKAAGVKFLLVLSVPTAELTDTVFGKQFADIEAKVKSLGVPHSFIRLPIFVENIFASKDSIKGQSAFYGPLGADKPFTPVTVADAGHASALILSSADKHIGKTYNLVSHRTTQTEVAQAFTGALEREVKYVQVAYDAAKKAFLGLGLPEWQTNGVLELYKLMDVGSPVTNQPNLSDYETITGEKPTSFKDWLAPVAAAFK